MSSFGWIDHSEKQRRQVLEAIDLFREKDTRDELGLAGIRDAISDKFFPGTSQLQTRARYFFFVPWVVQQHETTETAAELAKRVREVEIGLIDTLLASGAFEGVIGRVARSSLVRTPSSIYWNGLKSLKFVSATNGRRTRGNRLSMLGRRNGRSPRDNRWCICKSPSLRRLGMAR